MALAIYTLPLPRHILHQDQLSLLSLFLSLPWHLENSPRIPANPSSYTGPPELWPLPASDPPLHHSRPTVETATFPPLFSLYFLALCFYGILVLSRHPSAYNSSVVYAGSVLEPLLTISWPANIWNSQYPNRQ